MPTNKNRFATYLTDELSSLLIRFCQQNKVTHSKGIELIVQRFLSSELQCDTSQFESPDKSTEGLNDKENKVAYLENLEALEEKVLNSLTDRVNDNLEMLEHLLKENLSLVEANLTSKIEAIAKNSFENARQGDKKQVQDRSFIQKPKALQDENTLSDEQLSQKIGFSRKTLYKLRVGVTKHPSAELTAKLVGWQVTTDGKKWQRRS